MKKKQAPSDFKVEKGIRLPKYHTAPRKYPFDEMKVGDSFFIKGIHVSSLDASRQLAEERTGFKFTARTMDGGARVWRIK